MAFPPDHQPDDSPAPLHPLTRRRSGARKFVVLLTLVVALGAGWSAFWFYAAKVAEDAVTGWQVREAKAGRDHRCIDQDIGGFPFRVEITCSRVESVLRNFAPPMQLTTAGLHAAVQIYEPTLLIAEVSGPLTIGSPGAAPEATVGWRLAQISVRGTPATPERVSLALDGVTVSRPAMADALLAGAEHFELHGRIADGSVTDHPVVETVMRVTQGTLPILHPAAAVPVNAELTAMLRGLKDFSPKPWAARFREIQAADGRIDIVQARIVQADTLAVGSGTLSLNGNGGLEGQLQLTVAGLEHFLRAIGIENSAPVERLAGVLDRLMPGLGAAARSQAGAGVIAGMNLIGEQTTLEGRKAVAVPLRVTDGAMQLGPVPIGRIPPLF